LLIVCVLFPRVSWIMTSWSRFRRLCSISKISTVWKKLPD